jgi:transposase-like protein/DNA-directed RNA polymerase subunit RPC12/RpoP
VENISHILEAIQSLSAQLFVFRTNIEPLTLIQNVPEDLANLINNPELSELIDSACLAAMNLNDFLKPFLKMIHSYTHKKKSSSNDSMIPYADFTVDAPPIIRTGVPEQIRAEDLIALNHILPVKHRDDFAFEGNCPHCGAGNEYIYLNNGRRQYACKVCKKTFTDKVSPRGTSGFYCPYCNSKLSAHHDRKGYVVYICPSRRCSYYKEKKAKKEAGDDLDLITSSKQYRYHYHYREFKFNMDEISSYCKQVPGSVDLSRIHVDMHTLGLIMTYYINYGMSTRKVVNVMRDVHGVRISHQTVINYSNSVAALIKDMVDYYPYDLSHVQAGDETYVHVMGKNNYVFFFSDPIKKIITSYYIFSNRDTKNAVISMWNVMRKFIEYPDDLTFITDGNPIYNAAQLFFEMQGFKFDLHQVIGVKNMDDVSRKYRPWKQTEERLNRTFKENYHPTNGYASLDQANSYMVCYVAFFNFLRRHSSLGYKPPVILEAFDEYDLMPDKWLKLIQMSGRFHREAAQA